MADMVVTAREWRVLSELLFICSTALRDSPSHSGDVAGDAHSTALTAGENGADPSRYSRVHSADVNRTANALNGTRKGMYLSSTAAAAHGIWPNRHDETSRLSSASGSLLAVALLRRLTVSANPMNSLSGVGIDSYGMLVSFGTSCFPVML